MALLWLDIETTGLNPKKDLILEIAWTITRDDLSEHLVGVPTELVQVDIQKAKMLADEFVLEMHDQNGLWDDVRDLAHRNLTEIEDLILGYIYAGVADDEPVYLAGSSVHFDRSFLEPVMPRLAKRLHHRHYDLSTLKLFFRSIGINSMEAEPDHRAKEDVIEELATARTFYDWTAAAKTMSDKSIVKASDA